ncbi:hypothetical protein D3C72_2122370 [compost metagenome]
MGRLVGEGRDHRAVGLGNHLVLRFEVVPDEPGRHAGADGDLAHRRALQAEFGDAIERRFDQFLAALSFRRAMKRAAVHAAISARGWANGFVKSFERNGCMGGSFRENRVCGRR